MGKGDFRGEISFIERMTEQTKDITA